MARGMTVLKIEASLVGRELLINDHGWESTESDSAVDEVLLEQLTLDQQWTLLTVLRKTLNKAVHVYCNSRTNREGTTITDDARRARLQHQPVSESPSRRK
jgi:hypothetical protein